MLKIDLHIHTIASGHAYNTILEYINRAKELKMKIIGISDHGPGNSEAIVSEVYFKSLNRIPKIINGIRILKGVEANIMDIDGSIDISDKTLNKLDFVIANFHLHTDYSDRGAKINSRAIINTIKSQKINILSHPYNTEMFNIEVKKIYEAACQYDILLEINIPYLKIDKFDSNISSNLKAMVNIVKKHNKKVLVGSDAHNIWELADDSPLRRIKKKIGLTDNLIINNYPKELLRKLKINE